jgi:hypothetical protein
MGAPCHYPYRNALYNSSTDILKLYFEILFSPVLFQEMPTLPTFSLCHKTPRP